MGSRLYFPNALAAPAGVTPAYDASWGVTATAVRRKLMHKPTDDGGINNSRSVSETSATPINGLVDQYISDPLPFNKSISGTVLASVKGRGGGGTAYLRIVVKVISNTGTIKATLFSGVSNDAYGPNAPFYTCVVGGNLTPFDALAGDRIVVERGAYFNNTTTTSQGVALSVNTDYNYPDGASTFQGDPSDIQMTRRPWIEFSQDDIWGPPKPTIASEPVAVVEQPVRTPTRLTSTATVVGEQPVRTPTRLSGIIVNALVPRAGQISKAIYAAGFPTREPRVKLPDGRWVPLRPARPRETGRPASSHFNFVMGRTIELSRLPESDEFVVLMTTSKESTPRRIQGLPTGIPGMVWEEVYRSLDDRDVVWFGTGGTVTGSVSISAYGTDANGMRMTSLMLVEGGTKNLAYQKSARSLDSTPAIFTPEVGGRDHISFLHAISGGSNPAPTIVKPSDWAVIQQNVAYTQLARANPFAPNPSDPLSVAYFGGIAGQLVVIGGSTPYEPPMPSSPIPETIRYYIDTVNSAPMDASWSSKWVQTPSNGYRIGLVTHPIAASTGNNLASKPAVLPGSTAAFQLITPPLVAGTVSGSFRFVWPVDYIGDAYVRAILKLVSFDGSVVRGELADITANVGMESAGASLETKTLSGPLTPLVAQKGDCIVVEIGAHFISGGGGSANFGVINAVNTGDYPFQDGVIQDGSKRGWLEFIPN